MTEQASKVTVVPGQVASSRKFYGVRQGSNLGLYYIWSNCEREVKGYSGAEFQSFRSQEEANRYLGK